VGRETLEIQGKVGPPLERALAELAERQWGVVSLAQLRELGLATGAVEHRVRLGRLHRVHRGVYAVGHVALRREGRWLAAVLACGTGAVLSHRTAAKHWGLLHSDQTRIDVTAPRSRGGAPGIRLHRSRSLDALDTTSHEGIPITTVPRTLLDLAARVNAHRLERALAQAERLRLYDDRAIRDLLARTNGHRGKAILERAIAHEPKLTRSELEARVLGAVRDAGLPEPMVNTALNALDHQPIEVDLHWPAHHLIVELDGYATHGTRHAFEADRRRDAALQAAGQRVMRFTWHTDRNEMIARLRAVLR
jgi:predicted transcriptional regulator of viral defense system